MSVFDVETVILGAGPAGTAPLVRAVARGEDATLLGRGILWLDRQSTFAVGSLAQIDVPSYTGAAALLDLVDAAPPGTLGDFRNDPTIQALRSATRGSCSVATLGNCLRALGERLRQRVSVSDTSHFLGGVEVDRVDFDPSAKGRGRFRVRAVGAPFANAGEIGGGGVAKDGAAEAVTVRAARLVCALGGGERPALHTYAPLAYSAAGDAVTLVPFRQKAVLAGELFRRASRDAILARLAGIRSPRVVVVGGGDSALSAARLLVGVCERSGTAWRVEVFCRRPPALQMGADLAATVRVYSPRADADVLVDALDAADLVVSALGYRPRTVPFRVDGAPFPLADGSMERPLTDEQCRLLDADGAPIGGAYAVGLAAGSVPGGGPGRQNDVGYFQGTAAERLLTQLLAEHAAGGRLSRSASTNS